MVLGERITGWLGRLVRIPSVNPAQAGPRSGIAGEAAIGEAVAGWFRELGLEVDVHEVLPGRANIYGRWHGGNGPLMALDTHLDTVGVEQMTTPPFCGELRDGRVWGRGAVDTKASLAVALALVEAAREKGLQPRGTLLLACTVDEEVEAFGAPAFAAWLAERQMVVDQLAVAEPTRCVPVIAHKGVLRLSLTVAGSPAHSSQPHLGRNAITAAAHVILALDQEHHRLQTAPGDPQLGAGSLTVTIVQGGTGMNVVPDRCSLIVDRRLVAGEEPAAVARQIEAVAIAACPTELSVEVKKQINAFSQPPESPWITWLASCSGNVPATAPYCTNAWAYGKSARECAVIGPGSIDQAHGTEEWVELFELEKLAAIYANWWFNDWRR